MIVLGLDAGMAACGWGVISVEGPRVVHVAHGTIVTRQNPHLMPIADLARRVQYVGEQVADLCQKYRITAAAIEAFTDQRRTIARTTAIALGNVLGTLRNVLTMYLGPEALRHPVGEYEAYVGRLAVTGFANAPKQLARDRVAALLRMPRPRTLHASDALAIAIHHARVLRVADRRASLRGPMES